MNIKPTNNWINLTKGFGIILIVIGHVTTGQLRDFLYVFHVPLFFFLSGYLFKSKSNFRELFFSKFKSLMVPYLTYLCLFTLLIILKDFAKGEDFENISVSVVNALYGGKALTGWFSVFWFITSLFVTQLLCYFFIKLPFSKIVIVIFVFLLLAYLQEELYPDFLEFWAFNTAFYCVPIFLTGHIYNKFQIKISTLTLLFMIFLSLYFAFPSLFYTDIKQCTYGLPIVTFLMSIIFVLFVFEALKIVGRYQISHFLNNIGMASMTIMYLHQPIQITLSHQIGIKTEILVIFVTLIVCLLLHLLLVKTKLIQKLFLGYSK